LTGASFTTATGGAGRTTGAGGGGTTVANRATSGLSQQALCAGSTTATVSAFFFKRGFVPVDALLWPCTFFTLGAAGTAFTFFLAGAPSFKTFSSAVFLAAGFRWGFDGFFLRFGHGVTRGIRVGPRFRHAVLRPLPSKRIPFPRQPSPCPSAGFNRVPSDFFARIRLGGFDDFFRGLFTDARQRGQIVWFGVGQTRHIGPSAFLQGLRGFRPHPFQLGEFVHRRLGRWPGRLPAFGPSERTSKLQPVNLFANRTFWPAFPMAKDSWSSATNTSARFSTWLMQSNHQRFHGRHGVPNKCFGVQAYTPPDQCVPPAIH
jgi:hypothetical protein